MKITAVPNPQLDVTLTATVPELQLLFNATRPGRRTKEELAALEYFGDLVALSHPDFIKGVIGGEKATRKLREKRSTSAPLHGLPATMQTVGQNESTYRESESATA